MNKEFINELKHQTLLNYEHMDICLNEDFYEFLECPYREKCKWNWHQCREYINELFKKELGE